MNSRPKNIKNMNFILFVFLSFEIISSSTIKELIFDAQAEDGEYIDIMNSININIQLNKEYTSKFIRLLVHGLGTEETTNYIVSFYQDSQYKKRTQLSQSFNSEAELFLNEAQLKSGHIFFTVECDKYPCSFKYQISQQENIEINLEERNSYTYYVTEETKEMNFVIHGKPELPENTIFKGNNVLTVWAKGNKGITSELDAKNKEKHSELNAYLIKLEKLEEFSYNFKVKGEIGDLINVGLSFFDGTFHNLFYQAINGNTKEISGFLKRNTKEMNCFKIKKINNKEEGFISFTNYNNYDIDLMTVASAFIEDTNYFKRCLSLSDTNEGFYSFQYIIQNEENIANIYPPQILGVEYSRLIKEGDIIQLIPIKPDYDFNYITYNINIRHGKVINAYINSCETYPLCKVNSETLNNSIKLQRYNSFSISFSKNEIDQFSSSPIDKKQKVLLIPCEKGTVSIHEAGGTMNSCLIKINMYTDKNKFYLEPYFSHYRYLPKGNEFHAIIGNKNSYVENMILNFELISGNSSLTPINVEQQAMEQYTHNGKQLFIFKDKEVEIKVKAIENSFYHLNYIIKNKYAIDYTFTIGANYLFSLANKPYEHVLFSESENIYNRYSDVAIPIIVDFYPYNCKIKVKNTINLDSQSVELNESNGFYQDISTNNEQNIKIISLPKIYNYTFIKDEEKKDCLVDVSYFPYNSGFSDAVDSIILSNDNPKKFKFTSEHNVIKLAYPIADLEQNYTIKFELINSGKYKINFFFNDKISDLKYDLNETKEIIIKKENYKDICKAKNQICKLSFNIEAENNTESFLGISVFKIQAGDDNNSNNDNDNNNNNNDNNNNKNKNNNTLTIVIVIISIIVVIAVILIIIYFLYKKNSALSKDINTVSFGDQLYDNQNTQENVLIDK